jgi:hypothetical protein
MKVLYPTDKNKVVESIFLAGTIDMGNSIDWQQKVIDALSEYENLDLYNPRRSSWDSSWEQTIENEQFKHQVDWELTHLEKCDLAILFLAPNSMSPISLLELGLFKDKMIICCPEGFYRKGNVDVVADRYGIPVFEDFDSFLVEIKSQLDRTI